MRLGQAAFAILLLSAAVCLPELVVPNFPSFKLKTRTDNGEYSSTVHTLYLQGARSRSEFATLVPKPGPGVSTQSPIVVITQCDTRRNIAFDPAHKTFSESPIQSLRERMRRYDGPQPAGPQVSVSIDSVDTGERRNVGPYVARHVKTTTRVEPASGAVTHASVETRDGWYIDLPHMDCEDQGEHYQAYSWLGANQNERMRFSRTGSGKTGFAVEEVIRKTELGRTSESRTETVEVSSEPMDPSLFELPSGFAPALHAPLGTDYTQPDTLSNRVSAYWAYLRWRMARAFY